MKKIFLFFSAVLVSLAMHATVVTSDIALSDFNDNNTATYEDGTITAAEGWQYVQKLSGFDVYGLSDSQVNSVDLVVELSAVPTAEVFVQISYSDEIANDFSITVEQTQGRVALASKNVTGIAIKLKAAGSATLSNVYFYKVVGKKEPIQLFDGSETPHVAPDNWDDAWNGRLLLDGSSDIAKFAKAHEGDTIAFTYTSTADQCYIYCNNNKYFEDYANGQIHINASQAEPGAVMKFALRSTDITNLQAGGMNFSGINYTLTDVSLITYEQQFMEEIILNTGEEVLDWNQHWVHTSGLPTLAAGDELRVTVSAVTGEYPQVNFRHDDEGNSPIVVDDIEETVPKVYSVSLTAAQANDINSGKLFIVGQNNSLSRFAIAQPRSIYTALYHGEKAMDWDGLFFEASNFSGLTVGDRICANVSEIGDRGDYPKLIFSANYTEFTPSAQYDFSASHAAPMTVSYPVTAEMLSLIQTNGLRLRGEYCTVTEVYVQTAEPATVSYNLKVSSAGMATLVLPFNVSTLPAGVEAYTLVNNGDETIWATPVSSIEADKPVLIVAAQNEDPGYEFVNEIGGNGDITGKAGTYRNEALVGTYRLIKPLYGDDGEGGNYHYILQKKNDKVGFYKVGAAECSIAPYRAYLSCGYPGASAPAPMRIVFHKDNTTDMESVQHSAISTQKILRNGQILIIRDNKIVNVLGQQL